MARKQARHRKQTKAKKFTLPSIPVARFTMPLAAAVVVLATYHVSGNMLDRSIESIAINGPFQRVTALQIEEAISTELDAGFLGADVGRMQKQIQALSWIDSATVARRWPNRIAIRVSEQVPAAIWDERGLLNVRGELFVTEARHVPAELPRLSGPRDRANDVARRYLEVREQLIPLGLDLRQVHLDARGAWHTGNAVLLNHGNRHALFGQIGPADQTAQTGADYYRWIVAFGPHFGGIGRNLATIQGQCSGCHGRNGQKRSS